MIVRLDVAEQHRKEHAQAQGGAETPETPSGFIKKSQKTPKPDLDLAKKRKKEVEND